MSEFRVYRNLHHNDWTVQAWEPKRGWRKLVGLNSLWTPEPVEFIIGEKARESVRKNKRKQVHAYAVIKAFDLVGEPRDKYGAFDVTYTPYNDDGFSAAQVGGFGQYYPNIVGCELGTLFATDGHIYTNGISLKEF